MKKIAILTLYFKNYNYGGQLQAYALWKVISDLGYDCEQISFVRDRKKVLFRKIRALLKSPMHEIYELFILHLRRWQVKTEKQKDIIKNNIQCFDEFMNKISHTEVFDSEKIKKLNQIYDCFIVGSDQVWNPEFVPMTFFFDFVEDEKPKLSYAASIRINSFERKEGKIISSLLNRFDYISVREEESVKLLKSIGVIGDIDVSLDPTMLLSSDEWDSIIEIPKIQDKYIVLYLIRDKNCLEKIVKYAKKNHYKIVSINEPGYVAKENCDFIQISSGIGPKEFLGLIKNAEFVFPNSFHGTVFSIIFNKQFYVYGDIKTDQRKITLLKEYGLLDRMIGYDCDISQLEFNIIDYSKVNYLLKEKKEKSLSSLQNRIESSLRENK